MWTEEREREFKRKAEERFVKRKAIGPKATIGIGIRLLIIAIPLGLLLWLFGAQVIEDFKKASEETKPGSEQTQQLTENEIILKRLEEKSSMLGCRSSELDKYIDTIQKALNEKWFPDQKDSLLKLKAEKEKELLVAEAEYCQLEQEFLRVEEQVDREWVARELKNYQTRQKGGQ